MVVTDNQSNNLITNGYSTESDYGGIEMDCTHIAKACNESKVRKAINETGILHECPECIREAKDKKAKPVETEEYEYDESLWMCLQCGIQLCGREKNQHALDHNKKPFSDQHEMTLNTTHFHVWCYRCDKSVYPNQNKKLLSCVELIKRECDKQRKKEEKANADKTPEKIELVPVIPLENPIVEVSDKFDLNQLPRVRGLSNLGNTCFYNAVLQCLSQTPFLLQILKEAEEPGETFTLPGGPITLDSGEEILMKQINGNLNSWGVLTKALAETLEALQSGVNGVYTPRPLLNQLSQKWPQFGTGDQQDSHELLRHLLESVRCEDLRRYQAVILKLLGYKKQTDPARIDAKVKQQIKFYGGQASERILRPEQVFRGFLVSTLTCQDCFHKSSRHESFLDISLPILTEKPHPPQLRRPGPDTLMSQSKTEKKRERRTKRALKKQQAKEKAAQGSSSEQTDGDVEDNDDEPEATKKPVVTDDNGNAEKEVRNEIIEVGISQASKFLQKTNALADQMDETSLNEDGKQTKRKRTYSVADWSTTLAPKYQYEEGECSVQSCLNNFTWIELMTGNNKVTCDACTKRINGKGGKSVHTNATKQLLISSPPAVLILHLKRFQVGVRCSLRKMSKHVTFPLVLDIAPFCASKVKKLENVHAGQKQLPYSLYGVVEHSGTMHGGHYVAYVKVRQRMEPDDPRWKFIPKGSRAELDQIDEQRAGLEQQDSDESSELSTSSDSSNASSDVEGAVGGAPALPRLPDPLPGRWYYVSDSRVQSVPESEVLNAQAYLLFYERIDICQDE